MPITVDVVPQGWWGLVDADSFYPDDLPQDWRLAYFANRFAAVLVPAADWLQRSESELAAWRADVHAGFHFYLESTSDTDDEACVRATTALESALIAFVDTRQRAGVDGTHALLAPRSGERVGRALCGPRRLNADLRAARAWLEAQRERPRLVVLEQPRSAELERWHDLLLLLGLR